MRKPAMVVLVDIRPKFDICAIASARLKTFALADERLAAAVRIEVLTPGAAEPVRSIVEAVAAMKPDIIGFSSYIWNFAGTFEAIRLARRRCPDALIVVGGPYATDFAQDLLARNSAIDMVVRGEGEETLRELLIHLVFGQGEKRTIAGLCYREGAGVVQTADRASLDLAKLPPVYCSGGARLDRFWPTVLLEGSRGCPLECTFCEWGAGMRYLPLDHLAREFRYLADKTSLFYLTDSDLLLNRKRGLEVLELFLEATGDHPCRLSFQVNATFLCKEAVDIIARRPEKFQVECGLQSIEPRVLEAVDRAFNVPRMEANLADLRRRAPAALFKFSLIFGLPKDDLGGFRRTVNWVFCQRPSWAILHNCLVLPGTQMRRDAEKLGLVYSPECPWQVFETPDMSRADMERAKRLSFFARMFFTVGASAYIQDAAEAMPDRPMAYVELFEAWIDRLTARGLDLTFGVPLEDFTDPFELENYATTAALRISSDKLLQASIAAVTRELVGGRLNCVVS